MTAPALLALVDDALATHYGHRPARASVSFVGVAPIEVLRFEPVPGQWVYASLGMSAAPMTPADEFMMSGDGPRAELLLALRDESGTHADVWRKLAILAAAPAVEGVVYRADMTVDLGEPLTAGSRCTGGVVVAGELGPVETGEGSVELLQVVPALSTELAWARVRGTAALRERWQQAGTDLLDLGRGPVALS